MIPIFKARVKETDLEVIGYLIEIRKYLGFGTYSQNETDYLIAVNEISMPGGPYGTYIVDKSSVEKYEKT